MSEQHYTVVSTAACRDEESTSFKYRSTIRYSTPELYLVFVYVPSLIMIFTKVFGCQKPKKLDFPIYYLVSLYETISVENTDVMSTLNT